MVDQLEPAQYSFGESVIFLISSSISSTSQSSSQVPEIVDRSFSLAPSPGVTTVAVGELISKTNVVEVEGTSSLGVGTALSTALEVSSYS
ncbi:hypothetical protein ES705_29766 [subsurface metagenome]